MKAGILAVLFIVGISFAGGQDNIRRTDAIDSMKVINVASSDTTIKFSDLRPIRCIFADVGGIVKIKIKTYKGDTITRVRALNDAVFYPVTGVVKVFPLYNGSDSTTCQVYDSTGVLRRGIGLGF